jgi:hypothetical protein
MDNIKEKFSFVFVNGDHLEVLQWLRDNGCPE